MGHGGAALDQQLQHALAAEVVEHLVERALHLEGGVDLGAGRGPAQHHPSGSRALDQAHGERRVVGPHGAGPDQHGVALGPQAVGVGPGRLAR